VSLALGALAAALVLAAPASSRPSALRLVSVGTFDQPTQLVAAPGDPAAIYVIERPGIVVRFAGVRRSTFLDIRPLVRADGEQGLLSLAFAPDYPTSRLFYVDYTARNGNTVVAEYRATGPAPVRGRMLLNFADPAPNHNGGQLAFGPDERLWWGNGDGGGQGDEFGNGQRTSGDFAKIKRLDVRAARASWQTWAIGLRNPWRFSFDRATGALYIGDVGQNAREEIDYVPARRSHLNFGWNRYEGNARFGDEPLAAGWRYVQPLVVYSHAEGCSVTGGYVYEGRAVPAAVGRYFYGDYCSGTVWSLRVRGGKATELRREPALQVPGLSSFGEDAAGELYLASVEGGAVYRLAG